jgi:hypothetical protein
LRAGGWRNFSVLRVVCDFLVGGGERCAFVSFGFVALAIDRWNNLAGRQQRQNDYGKRASNEKQPSPL